MSGWQHMIMHHVCLCCLVNVVKIYKLSFKSGGQNFCLPLLAMRALQKYSPLNIEKWLQFQHRPLQDFTNQPTSYCCLLCLCLGMLSISTLANQSLLLDVNCVTTTGQRRQAAINISFKTLIHWKIQKDKQPESALCKLAWPRLE